MTYQAPVKDMMFVIKELAGLEQVGALPGCEDATEETVEAVLEESGRFVQEVLAPLNWTGDTEPSTWANGVVSTTPGDRKSTRLNSSHSQQSRMPSSA